MTAAESYTGGEAAAMIAPLLGLPDPQLLQAYVIIGLGPNGLVANVASNIVDLDSQLRVILLGAEYTLMGMTKITGPVPRPSAKGDGEQPGELHQALRARQLRGHGLGLHLPSA